MEPTDFMLPGKLGYYKHGDKTLQVQTEFARRPRPRVTTSVVVDGRIVHKVDREWTEDLGNEQSRLKLEIDLVNQHQEVMATVQRRAAELIETAVPKPAPEPPPQSAPKPDMAAAAANGGYPAPSIRDTIGEVLRTCRYAMALYEFDQNGDLVFRTHFRDVVADWDREFTALSAIIFGLPEIIRVGHLQHGIAYFGTENLIIARIRGRAFGILTENGADADTLRRDFPELFEATSDAGYSL